MLLEEMETNIWWRKKILNPVTNRAQFGSSYKIRDKVNTPIPPQIL